MTEKQRKDLDKLNKELDRFNRIHQNWIEYAKLYQLISIIVCVIIIILLLIQLR